MVISNADDLEESEIYINHDMRNDLYYFRMVDISACLNRDQPYRDLCIRIGDRQELFSRIVCKSIVRSQSISGDFKSGKIYGYFDIFGSSEYMVTIRRGGTIIEEDIPVEDGRFEVECEVTEGTYSIILYELEEDDSGFDPVSFEIGTYKLKIIDVRNFTGRDIKIKSIRDRNNRVAGINLTAEYYIRNLKLLDYNEDIGDGELYSYLYDSSDNKEMSAFVYYSGTFGFINRRGEFQKVRDAVVIFDNMQNSNEVLINLYDDEEYSPLKYSFDKEILEPDERRLTKYEKRRIRMIDDDLYTIRIEMGG